MKGKPKLMTKTAKRKRSKTKASGLNVASFKEKIQTKVHDKKFRTYWGMFFILLSVLLIISFTSFLFTWKEDQDILDMGWIDYIFNSSVNTENLVGKVGLLLSNIFVYNWFGISSYLFIILFFLLGMRFFNVYKKSLLTITKNILFPVIWLSLALAGIFGNETDIAGGKFGYQIHLWVKSFLGVFGEVILLIITLTAFLMLTIESVNQRIRLFFELLFSKGSFKELFKRMPEKVVNKAESGKELNKLKDIHLKDKLNIPDFPDEDGLDLDFEDEEEKIIKIIERKNYKLSDDGRKIDLHDDLGFEIENTGKRDFNKNEKDNAFTEFNTNEKIQKGNLLLDVTENQDIIANNINEIHHVNYDPK